VIESHQGLHPRRFGVTIDGLSEQQRVVSEAVEAAAWLDLRNADAGADRTEAGDCWGTERTVEARTLVDVLTRADMSARSALRIRGARIRGDLDLSRAELACPLEFENCYF
jgi:hypothetical protein